jgi:2-dehydro-3-deoxyphosphooctonate aldolase (KDO 8-P synthase)
VIESRDLALHVAEELSRITKGLPLRMIFKASYLKANRSHPDSFTGPGLEKGLEILDDVRRATGLSILSDVHCRNEVKAAAGVLDILQIPAYLCRQTPLIVEAARTGRPVNLKKGQFMSPEEMGGALKKVTREGNRAVMITERGTSFGYHDLIVDFRGLEVMKKWGVPVLFDGTHSVQKPGGRGSVSGGEPEHIAPLCRAAVAVGCSGLYLEVHPRPDEALSDAATMLPLDRLSGLLEDLLRIRAAVAGEG